ncbi:ketoacyl-ACP synthase III [Paraferrimonas haliotis]|uniref:Beta-ketoacyl-[acyl-carrier-protein] synthase III n=1 Tax=Paraferrimonas haliotis TaxID=2013866 RepID=A0AA37WXH0_9GAMM|nr:ketoacyl-ACP synthase III [Paraferrimonas haliotis]GLS84392.1 3-oxoacyl-[acyl-carrier-protein] synthase 3 [Paraferrimonas haliotis]
MPNAMITGWGKCVPPSVLTNDDLATFMPTSDEWIFSRTGIKQRHISHLPTSEMAVVAAKKALAAAGKSGADLDMIILATCSPDTLIPNIAATVQAEVGANCPAFDINAACSGFLFGLGMATAQIENGQCKNVLVIGAEKLSFYIDWSRRETAVLFGDGAGAALFEATDSDAGVQAYALNNDPAGREILKASFGAGIDKMDTESLNFHLQFEGREIFKRAIAGMGGLSHQVMTKLGLSQDDIDLVIPHQANERIIDTLIGKMKVDPSKAFKNIANYGNTSAATIPIAICDALEQGRIKPGQNVLSCAFGAGLTSAATVIKWGDRVTPIAESDAQLSPCEQTPLELIEKAVAHYYKLNPLPDEAK